MTLAFVGRGRDLIKVNPASERLPRDGNSSIAGGGEYAILWEGPVDLSDFRGVSIWVRTG